MGFISLSWLREVEVEGVGFIRLISPNLSHPVLLVESSIYYKYHLTTKIRGPHIQDYIEDIYLIDEVINKVDDLIIVVKDKPNDVLKNMLKMEFINNEFYVNIYIKIKKNLLFFFQIY